MAMSVIWTGMVVISLLCGLILGRGAEVAAAVGEGANAAVELIFSMAGVLCLWSGVMEVMRCSGVMQRLAKLFAPVLRLLYPQVAKDREIMGSIAANVSANLLGLGNAATPPGIEAAKRMTEKTPGRASDALCMLIVCNTASIQLLPTTVAALRGGMGSSRPFDILPAVWLASILSVGVGIGAAKIMGHLWRVAEEKAEKRRVR